MKKLHALVWSLVLGLTPASLLYAQQPSNNTGHSLENSLQVGSGGMNSPIGQPDYRSRNDVITGNVSGLGYFHGKVGYNAPNEFGSRTADDSLFRFNATSYPTNPGYPAANGALNPGAVYPGQVQSVYRTSAATTAGDVYQSNGSGALFIRPSDTSYHVDTKDIAGYSLYNDLSTSSRPNAIPGTTVLGETVQQQGNSLQVQASPLFGVRQPDASNLPAALGTTDRMVRPPEPLLPGAAAPNPPYVPDADSSAIDGQLQGRVNAPLNGAAYGAWNSGQANAGMNNTRNAANTSFGSPAMELGSQIQGRVESTRADQAKTLDQRIAQIQARMFSPIGNRSVPAGQDAYLDLLTQIYDQQHVAATGKPSATTYTLPNTSLGANYTPSVDLNNPSTNNDINPNDPNTAKKPALIMPTAEQLRQAQEARQQELITRGFASPLYPKDAAPNTASTNRGAKIGDKTLPPNAGPQTPAPNTPPTKANASLSASEDKLQTMLRSIDYRAKPLATLAPKSEDAVAVIMREAEEAMVAGKYFTADERYRAALAASPKSALAKVGLVHAQLGAGLTRSAAFTLRQLLEAHPELIAMQYEPRLLPAAQRLEALQKEIDNLISNTQRPEPAILLAYLGYQFQMKTLVEYGLNIAETRDAADPLITLLRRIWLHETPPAAVPATPPAAPVATPK